MDEFEKVKLYKDDYLLLKTRKKLMKLKAYFVWTCKYIISTKLFENIVLFVIIWNSY